MTVSIQPLTPTIGAEVTGIDLKQSVSAEVAEQLQAALANHVVLVIRDQQFEPADYLDAMRVFGEPMPQHYSQYNLEDYPLIGTITQRDGQKPADMWHTDHTNHECPPKATVLYAVSLPSSGGDTSFANMRAAYQNFPDEIKQQIQGLQTVNTLDGGPITARPEDIAKYGAPVRHPLVRTHPETGAPAVYFHPTKSKTIDGMSPDESQALLQKLLDLAIQPSIVYRHKWRLGDVVLVDNRSAMHQAHTDYDQREYRLLYRIILKGDRPV